MKFHLLTIFLLAGCAVKQPIVMEEPTVAGDANAPSQITPAESMAIARQLATHPWQPFAGNILHGNDPAGILVNTPDASLDPAQARRGWWLPGVVNEGIPYKWGGFDGPASFDAAIAKGSAAGDVSSPAKRRADNAGASSHAAGLDCSGFVSRCLKLPTVHDTRQLPAVCDPLPNPADLRPGDLLNVPDRHVVLCGGWSKPDKTWIYYYETGGGPQYWKPALKEAPLASMLALGYQPLRYRGMSRPATGDSKDALTRAAKASAVSVPNPSVGEP